MSIENGLNAVNRPNIMIRNTYRCFVMGAKVRSLHEAADYLFAILFAVTASTSVFQNGMYTHKGAFAGNSGVLFQRANSIQLGQCRSTGLERGGAAPARGDFPAVSCGDPVHALRDQAGGISLYGCVELAAKRE